MSSKALSTGLDERAVATAEDLVEFAASPENCWEDPKFGAGSKIGEDREPGSDRIGHHTGEVPLEFGSLGPLVVDGPSRRGSGSGRRLTIHSTARRRLVDQRRGHHGGGGDHRGDRHVPVEETKLTRATHQRINGPGHPDDREAGHPGRVLDSGEVVTRGMHDAQRGIEFAGAEPGRR